MHTETKPRYIYSWSISLCLASFWVADDVGAADAAHLLMESWMSSNFSNWRLNLHGLQWSSRLKRLENQCQPTVMRPGRSWSILNPILELNINRVLKAKLPICRPTQVTERSPIYNLEEVWMWTMFWKHRFWDDSGSCGQKLTMKAPRASIVETYWKNKHMTLKMSYKTLPAKEEFLVTSKEELTVLSIKPKMSVSIIACCKHSSLSVRWSSGQPLNRSRKKTKTTDEEPLLFPRRCIEGEQPQQLKR